MKDVLLEPLDFNKFPICESYLEGKMTKNAFNAKRNKAKDLLELVNSDVCSPMFIQARGGYKYLRRG